MLYGAVRIQKAQLKPAENQKRGDVPGLHHGRKARLAAVKRIVAGEARGRPIGAVHLVDNRFAQRIKKMRRKFRLVFFESAHQRTKVYHVGVALGTRVHIVFRSLGLAAVGGIEAVVVHGKRNSL